VAGQSDLRLREYFEIPQDKGPTLKILKDGLAEWMKHPSGKPFLVNWFWDQIEITNPDDPMRKRAQKIAAVLKANIFEEEIERDDEDPDDIG